MRPENRAVGGLGRGGSGASTQGVKWCKMHHGEKWGGIFLLIMMLLL